MAYQECKKCGAIYSDVGPKCWKCGHPSRAGYKNQKGLGMNDGILTPCCASSFPQPDCLKCVHAELTKLREENRELRELVVKSGRLRGIQEETIKELHQREYKLMQMLRQAKIEVLHGILANAADWHLKNYSFPLRGETGHEAISVELHETLKQLEDKN